MIHELKGIHILQQTPVMEYTTIAKIGMTIGILIAILAVIAFIIKSKPSTFVDFTSRFFKGFLAVYMFGLLMALAILCIRHPVLYAETGHYTYECKFDDSVSVNDIGKSFKIINVKDNIWTIQNK